MKVKTIAMTVVLLMVLGSFQAGSTTISTKEVTKDGDGPLNSGLASLSGSKKALTVGVNQNLNYCDDDARNMYGVLTDNGWSENDVELITDNDGSVTKNTIVNKLNNMGSQSTASSVSFFSFSGHGTLSGGQAAICLSDGNLWADELDDILDDFNGRVVCVFDSCHAGGMVPPPGEEPFDADEFVASFITTVGGGDENRVLLMACRADQTTVELNDLEAGLWTYFVHEGLRGSADSNGDGKITAEETFNYAKPKAEDYHGGVNPQIYDGDTSSQVTIIGADVESDIHVTVKICDIIRQDEIEPYSITGADWYYTIRIFSQDVSYVTTKYGPTDRDHWSPNHEHTVNIIDDIVNIEIKLMEDDLLFDDLADISSRAGGGTDQFQLFEWYTGENENAIYHGTYNVGTGELTGDGRTSDGDEYSISGELDGESGDQNDAKIVFKIYSNYNKDDYKPKISVSPSSLEFGTITTGSGTKELDLVITNSAPSDPLNLNDDLQWTASDNRDWISLSDTSDSAPGGESDTITVEVDTSDLEGSRDGTLYTGKITITSNAADYPTKTVDVSITVKTKSKDVSSLPLYRLIQTIKTLSPSLLRIFNNIFTFLS